jgi:hypothetical protein
MCSDRFSKAGKMEGGAACGMFEVICSKPGQNRIKTLSEVGGGGDVFDATALGNMERCRPLIWTYFQPKLWSSSSLVSGLWPDS